MISMTNPAATAATEAFRVAKLQGRLGAALSEASLAAAKVLASAQGTTLAAVRSEAVATAQEAAQVWQARRDAMNPVTI